MCPPRALLTPAALALPLAQDEDTINTDAKEAARLKEIPVPVSVAQKRVEGTNAFELPKDFVRAPAPWQAPK